MTKNIIQHCGKNIPTEREMVINNYPGFGDTTFLHQATCNPNPNISHTAYAFWIRYFTGASSELEQAGKHQRQRFDQLILEGRALLLEKTNENDRQMRGQSRAGQYTLTVKRPADQTINYLNMIQKGLPELVDYIRNNRERPAVRTGT